MPTQYVYAYITVLIRPQYTGLIQLTGTRFESAKV